MFSTERRRDPKLQIAVFAWPFQLRYGVLGTINLVCLVGDA